MPLHPWHKITNQNLFFLRCGKCGSLRLSTFSSRQMIPNAISVLPRELEGAPSAYYLALLSLILF